MVVLGEITLDVSEFYQSPLLNKKVSSSSKKLSRAIKESRLDSKFHENNENLLRSIALRRDLDKRTYF